MCEISNQRIHKIHLKGEGPGFPFNLSKSESSTRKGKNK